MMPPTPSFSVRVDVTNPGQFFACCGLLELAHRRWPAAEGWFTASGFCVAVRSDVADAGTELLQKLVGGAISADTMRGDKSLWPIRLEPFDLTLDWWLGHDGKKTPLKLWAGQQTSVGITEKLRGDLRRIPQWHDGLFDVGQPLKGRFGFDPRSAWQALDLGFSPDKQDMKVATFPAVELFAAIGLQGFRPLAESRRGFCYAPWSLPLPTAVARAACAGQLPITAIERYRFTITDRGRYKFFDFATPVGDET